MRNNPLIRTLLFVVVLLTLDQTIGFALRTLYNQTFDGDVAGVVNQALANRNADVIVFGSSRACHHIASPELSKSLNKRVFNAGIDGYSVIYARALQSELLRRGTRAKLFLLQVDGDDLFALGKERLALVTPLAAKNAEVLALLEAWDPYVRVKLLFATYPFNSKVLSILSNWRRPPAPDQWVALPPHAGQPLVAKAVETPKDATTRPVNAARVQAIRDFIASARAADIRVFLFSGPRLHTGAPTALTRRGWELLATLAEGEGVTFKPLDQDSHPEFKQATLYRDAFHLDGEGARLFTSLVAQELAKP